MAKKRKRGRPREQKRYPMTVRLLDDARRTISMMVNPCDRLRNTKGKIIENLIEHHRINTMRHIEL